LSYHTEPQAAKGGLRDMENEVVQSEIVQTGIFDKIIELFNNSGFTAILAAIVTIIITGIFTFLSDKRRDQQEIVRQILPERMKAHGAVLEIIVIVLEKVQNLVLEHPASRPNLIMKYNEELNHVYIQNMMWLNKGVSDLFWELQCCLANATLSGKGDKLLKDEVTNGECLELLNVYSRYHGFIQNRIRLVSGISLLDKTLADMAVKPKKKGHKSP
jgi:hypothetical protein